MRTATIHATTQMKSVDEAMAIGRAFKESLQKCLRSLGHVAVRQHSQRLGRRRQTVVHRH